jgi:hypothetical protein
VLVFGAGLLLGTRAKLETTVLSLLLHAQAVPASFAAVPSFGNVFE